MCTYGLNFSVSVDSLMHELREYYYMSESAVQCAHLCQLSRAVAVVPSSLHRVGTREGDVAIEALHVGQLSRRQPPWPGRMHVSSQQGYLSDRRTRPCFLTWRGVAGARYPLRAHASSAEPPESRYSIHDRAQDPRAFDFRREMR